MELKRRIVRHEPPNLCGRDFTVFDIAEKDTYYRKTDKLKDTEQEQSEDA